MSGIEHMVADELSSPEVEAAAWFARHRAGPLRDQDAAAFRQWLTHSQDNVRAWGRQERLWTSLDAVGEAPTLLALREAARGRADQRRSARRRLLWGAALAASLAAVCLQVWRSPAPGIIRTESSSPVLSPATADLHPLPLIRDVSTRPGERALLTLADGSRITLNSNSAVHADYSNGRRSVSLLRGEAYFEVAKDKVHPFVVMAGARQIIAVGTAFNVRLEPKQLKVDLVEGKVRVVRNAASIESNGGQDLAEVLLEAGSTLVARLNAQDRIVTHELESDIAWRTGKLVFDGSRLADVVAEMNRYSNQKIELADRDLDNQRVSGVFDAEGGTKFAHALESYGLVRIVRDSGNNILLARP